MPGTTACPELLAETVEVAATDTPDALPDCFAEADAVEAEIDITTLELPAEVEFIDHGG